MENVTRFMNEFGSEIVFKPHQVFGVNWCFDNETCKKPLHKVRGGFIADEMGLGKTIMMIGVIIANPLKKTLIVLPNILINQWFNEIIRTTGHMPLVFHGPNKKFITMEQLLNAPIVITSYNIVALSFKKAENLHKIKWGRIIFDEAHHLRNKNGRFYGAKSLQSKIRWLISGTPVQNKRADFLNLCSFLFLPASFYTNPDNILELTTNFILRRTKSNVGILLPDINNNKESVRWTNESEQLLSLDIHEALKTVSGSNKLKMLIRARQICILPNMLSDKMNSLYTSSIIVKIPSHINAVKCSSKIDSVMATVISRANNGNGKLIFCHFRAEIDTIIRRLNDAGIHNVATFDGRTRQSTRTLKLAHNYDVLVLQIQTGCEGLNLQKDFSEVYFVSPHWNPAVEEQAVARCHRIGQTKTVHVFKYIMDEDEAPCQTLDKYISLIQETKREICNQIIC